MKNIKSFLVPKIQKLRSIIYSFIYNALVCIRKIDDKKVVLATNRGTKIKDNLEYVYNELKKYNYKIVVLATDKNKITYNLKFVIQISNAKYTIIDDFFPLVYPIKIRKGAKLIQVWHALGAFKKVGFSRIGKPGGPSVTSITHKNYTDAIVSSESIVKNYAEAFGITENKVHPLGIPRTDLFFDEEKKKQGIENVYKMYPNLKDKRIILFAPTFRGNGKKSAYYSFEKINLAYIYKNLNDKDVFIIKSHPFVKEKINIPKQYQDKIVDLTDFKDTNNLLLVTDLLITDYSSIIFDYAFLERPIIFYVPDIEEYKNSRDFYYDFEEYIYGICCKTEEELVQAIQKPKINKEKLNKFKQKFLNMCDGNSSKRFVELVIMQKGE